MRRIPLRTVLCAVFCVWGVVYLCGCPAPVDLSSFVEDEEVKDIIEQGSGTVNLLNVPSDGLRAGNKKITGLKPGKYYLVEEWDEDSNFLGVQFVSPDGERSTNLTGIGTVRGEDTWEITGLTNRYRYRVKSAEPLPGDVSYSALTSPGKPQSAPNTNGVIYLPEPEDDGFIFYSLTPPSTPPYEIVEIPISPAGFAKDAMRPTPNGDIISLIKRGTEFDYVFFGTTSSFYVLKVASGEDPNKPSEPGDLIITVNVSLGAYTGDNSPVLTAETVSYSQNDTGTIVFNVNNASQYTGFSWYIDGDPVGSGELTPNGATFALNKGLAKYKIVGDYIITVEASKDGKPYTAAILVTVSS